jgi:hypothetical protein
MPFLGMKRELLGSWSGGRLARRTGGDARPSTGTNSTGRSLPGVSKLQSRRGGIH